MRLKRLGALFLALLLLFQTSACTGNSSAQSSSLSAFIESQIETGSQASSQDESSSNVQNSSTTQNGFSSSISSQSSNSSQLSQSSEPSFSNNSSTTSSGQSSSEPKEETIILPSKCSHAEGDPYTAVDKTEFYKNYKTACCNLDASYRSKHGLLSGSLEVPGQYAQESASLVMSGKKYVRNTSTFYLDDGNTYVVLDSKGKEATRIHRAGGYITLEEVAAYMYAFGSSENIPANYTSKKSGKPNSSIWGEYLRVNHSYFIGDTEKYPYEPELPDISGCGGKLKYYEMDIGTTGTETPGYSALPYIQGNKINRGAARIVHARQDLNGNGIYETNEVYVFYTHNHYNDFREYLNYYGGWGEMFGNVTGGGEYSSETRANPTPYVQTAYKAFLS